MGLKAKKSFGQHFLVQDSIASNIAESLKLSADTGKVLEIGPGMGMLTKFLIEKDYELKVVEADRDMVAYISEHFPTLKDRIIFEDFMKVNLTKVYDGEPFCLIGNFPYNISSQIIFKTIEHMDIIPEMVGMFQFEMAERVATKEGSKTYGVISVLTQAFFDVEFLFKVKKGSFNPPPKVESAVIRLKRRETPRIECSYKTFRTIVKLSFSQRRKMLRNTLKGMVKNKEILSEPVFSKRPEMLSVEEFSDLTKLILENN